MTTKEIVNQITDTYTINNRATDNVCGMEECRYLTKDGRMCAVGMCMNELSLKEFGTVMGDVHDLNEIVEQKVSDQGLDYLLKEEYKGHPLKFWKKLQQLHDNKKYWDDDGLNERGKRLANLIIDEY